MNSIKNKEKIFIRQGDILFESVPEGSYREDEDLYEINSKTVALGEVTGHSHSYRKNDQVVLYHKRFDDMPSQVLVEASSTVAELQHQEHLSIQFPKGEYKIKREQSYNPFLKQIQRSKD